MLFHIVISTCISELGSAVLSSVLESKYYVCGSETYLEPWQVSMIEVSR